MLSLQSTSYKLANLIVEDRRKGEDRRKLNTYIANDSNINLYFSITVDILKNIRVCKNANTMKSGLHIFDFLRDHQGLNFN